MAKETKKQKEAREAAEKAAASRDLLAEAVQARNTGTPVMATEAEMSALVNAPGGALVEYNKQVVQGDKIAFRASELGMAAFANRGTANVGQPAPGPAWGSPAPQAGPTNPAPAGQPIPQTPGAPAASSGSKSFQFDANIPVPAPRRGGRGSTVYGFETMEVGHSFFIPVSEDNPNPAKRIASTVSSASERLKPKKFVVRSVDETATGKGKGARVWRTA